MRLGWANSCGVELYTHGWVTCEKLLNTLIEENPGGSQFYNNFIVFQPVRKELEAKLKNTLPVSDKSINTIQDEEGINLDDIVFDIAGDDYRLTPDISAAKTLNSLDSSEEAIQKASQKISVSKDKVKGKLIEIINNELQKQRDFKLAIFKDEEEILEILLIVDEL